MADLCIISSNSQNPGHLAKPYAITYAHNDRESMLGPEETGFRGWIFKFSYLVVCSRKKGMYRRDLLI